ncbi:FAD-dependent oxidoreductase [Streptomyces sp. NPDC093598]|uniref:FAD-dependent oxidoreductase n=1 Tax=Streptomyces sp. NPDC093598 TaxID=3366046 RepID=UPI00381A2867
MTGLEFTTDVLVVGGGPAATWAALKAAQDGADVILADKGYCGTSGATASAGNGVWYVPPEPAARQAAQAASTGCGPAPSPCRPHQPHRRHGWRWLRDRTGLGGTLHHLRQVHQGLPDQCLRPR